MYIKFGYATLRAIEESDADLLKRMINSPEIEENTLGWSLPVSSFKQEQWIKNFSNSMDCIRWMIELENGTVLGMACLTDIDWKNRFASIGIKIDIEEKNRMYGDVKDAYYAVLLYAFDELGLNRIEAATLDYNIFSLKLSRSMGFVDEGIRRKKYYKNGQWHDIIVNGLLKEEFVHYEDGFAPWQKKRR